MSDFVKKLTGKNDYEQAAAHIINNADVEAFKELVAKDDFLFDFIKQNASQRLEKAVNNDNYKNLLCFLKYYSPSYDDFITSCLAKFADEDLTDTMLEKLENGTDEEKTYCAKFFSHIQDTLSIELLRTNAYSDCEFLGANCAATLGSMKDETSFNDAIEKLKSNDDFEIFHAAKFLSAYGDKRALPLMLEAMKKSSMSENIAAELFYLQPDISSPDTLLALIHMTNALGEILPLTMVFDFELFNVFENLINNHDSKAAVVLLNAREKFNQLTENDEYIYDEDKNTKNEIVEIKNLLNSTDFEGLRTLLTQEMNDRSEFVMFAIDLAPDICDVRNLLSSSNPTIVLKSLEVLKTRGMMKDDDKACAFDNVTDENIRAIINAL